ncbi:hypothetical protein AAHA92_07140 [Salvia divinorum]|uniref:Uncharacterized protein n=1 Tax=Salvia divinorum TaxID=28513 RepID=A0ABD1I7Z4_SALDI
MLVSLAVSVSEMKRRLNRLYQEKHGELVLQGLEMEDQRREMVKYWVMAESSCPQFVIARSSVCVASSVITSFFYIIKTVVSVLDGTSTNAPAVAVHELEVAHCRRCFPIQVEAD